MNVKYRVTLDTSERVQLVGMVLGGKGAYRRLKRAQILLAADAGSTDEEIARNFRGTLSLGCYGGFGPKGVGAVCDPAAFAGVVRVEPGILGPRHGAVSVDLVESSQPEIPGWSAAWSEGVVRQTFRDVEPCVVITVGTPRG